eukprot:gene2303-1440_t
MAAGNSNCGRQFILHYVYLCFTLFFHLFFFSSLRRSQMEEQQLKNKTKILSEDGGTHS